MVVMAKETKHSGKAERDIEPWLLIKLSNQEISKQTEYGLIGLLLHLVRDVRYVIVVSRVRDRGIHLQLYLAKTKNSECIKEFIDHICISTRIHLPPSFPVHELNTSTIQSYTSNIP